MTAAEIDIFIDHFEDLGDVWTPVEVQRVYGDMSLQNAIADREASVGTFLKTMASIL